MQLAYADINLSALRHNLAQVRRHAPNSQVMACIKANGYGHGAIEVAQALDSADAFAIARLSEAVRLRQQGIQSRLVLLEGIFDATELEAAVANRCDVVIHSDYQLRALEQASLSQPIDIWLKLDTGMHRIGVLPQHFAEFYQRLTCCPNVGQLRLMTHFACADELEHTATDEAIALFEQLTASHVEECSLSNSAAILRHPLAHRDWVRPGIMLYGCSPFAEQHGQQLGLQPVMTLKSKVIAVREHPANQAVGYGQQWSSPQATRLAVVGIGYGDGYPRHASSGTPVLINGQRFPLVGRVSMDMISVDIGLNTPVSVGDEVVLWGDQLPVEEIASASDTIGYELLCGVTRRVDLNYID